MSDLITDTARKMGLEPKVLFRKATEEAKFTNYLEVADYRFGRWFKWGEVPEYISDYCLTQWREQCLMPIPPYH